MGGPAEVETGNQVIYTMHIIMDQIVRHDVEGKPVPELATSVTSSADGKTITFTLRRREVS